MSSDAPAARVRLTANDFFLGLFAALRRHGEGAFSVRDDRFDQVIKDLYDYLSEHADEENVDLRFHVRPHPMYGDSRTVRDALTSAAQRRIISFDNPEYLDIRIQLDDRDAARMLESLEVRPGLFDELADRFVRTYRDRRPSTAS